VHDEILAKYPKARLKVFAVWFDMLAGDSRQLLDTKVLGDPRVTYYWDEGKVVGRWFSDQTLPGSGITWDAYFLYGPEARWDQAPGPLLSSSDGDVIGSTDQLMSAVRPFLSG
jgi:hypothetical protein